jgi:predicted glutamine amidotransferase
LADSHHLIGFIASNAERMPCLLHQHRQVPWLGPEDEIERFGVGRYESGQAFLRSKPGLLKAALSPLDLLAGQPGTPLLIARATSSAAATPEGIQPFRFRTWLLALQGAVELTAEGRSGMLRALPSFLHRAHNGGCDGELVFLQLMAALSHDCLLDAPGTHEGLVHRFRQAALATNGPVNIIASNGRDLLAYGSREPLLYCRFGGIDSCEPCRIGSAYSWIGSAHRSHQQFKGVCVASRRLGFAQSDWREIPSGQVLVVGSSLEVHCFD